MADTEQVDGLPPGLRPGLVSLAGRGRPSPWPRRLQEAMQAPGSWRRAERRDGEQSLTRGFRHILKRDGLLDQFEYALAVEEEVDVIYFRYLDTDEPDPEEEAPDV